MRTCDCCGGERWKPLFEENTITLGKCPDCDLHAIESIPEPEARMTEMEAGHYAGSLKILDAQRQIVAEKVLTEQFQTFVDLAARHKDGGHWLDIGCGAGLLIALAQQAGFTAEGIELNADRKAAAAHQTGAEIHGVPVETVGFPDDTFDVISLINVFSHLTAPGTTLRELRRILKPDGVLVMATGEMLDGVAKNHMHNWNLGDHLYFLGDRTMDRYAANIGFDLLERDRKWLPDEMYSRNWLRSKGRSAKNNAVKSIIRFTPGGLTLLRAVMMRRQADSKAHASVFALQPVPVIPEQPTSEVRSRPTMRRTAKNSHDNQEARDPRRR